MATVSSCQWDEQTKPTKPSWDHEIILLDICSLLFGMFWFQVIRRHEVCAVLLRDWRWGSMQNLPNAGTEDQLLLIVWLFRGLARCSWMQGKYMYMSSSEWARHGLFRSLDIWFNWYWDEILLDDQKAAVCPRPAQSVPGLGTTTVRPVTRASHWSMAIAKPSPVSWALLRVAGPAGLWMKELPRTAWQSFGHHQIYQCFGIWVWVNTYRYIFSGMNIHLPAILGFTRYQGFDPSPFDEGRLRIIGPRPKKIKKCVDSSLKILKVLASC